MTDISMPEGIKYGTVTGQFLSSEVGPNGLIPRKGSCLFRLSSTVFDNTNKIVIPQAPIRVYLDDSGRLVDEFGNLGQSMIATDSPYLLPLNPTYSVSFEFAGISMAGYSFSLPADTVVDLAEVVPVDNSEGTITIRGPKGTGANWRGKWDAGTTYNIDDAVSYAGSSFIATSVHLPNDLAPGVGVIGWDVLALEGSGPAEDAQDPIVLFENALI